MRVSLIVGVGVLGHFSGTVPREIEVEWDGRKIQDVWLNGVRISSALESDSFHEILDLLIKRETKKADNHVA